jgi:hypothetical protein
MPFFLSTTGNVSARKTLISFGITETENECREEYATLGPADDKTPYKKMKMRIEDVKRYTVEMEAYRNRLITCTAV